MWDWLQEIWKQIGPLPGIPGSGYTPPPTTPTGGGGPSDADIAKSGVPTYGGKPTTPYSPYDPAWQYYLLGLKQVPQQTFTQNLLIYGGLGVMVAIGLVALVGKPAQQSTTIETEAKTAEAAAVL